MPNHNVSRAMSTQHPDNVSNPFFVDNSEIAGDDEIKEAFYPFSHLKCREQLWDCEGKEVDNFVVKKLLSQYGPYFRKNRLGRDIFLTLRVPNPAIEKDEGKILLETLESIPRNFDTARLFYGEDIAPIFEISLPMTTSAQELLSISNYYRKHVVGKQAEKIIGDKTVADWIGTFRPESMRIIPLIETKEAILDAHNIVENFLKEEKPSGYQRVWLARSDPALNYGNLATVLTLKIAIQRLRKVQEKASVDILPILGCGSAPFRGNFKPTNVENCVKGYPSVHTYTLQSAFKYDYPVEKVQKAVEFLNNSDTSSPIQVDEEKCLEIIEKLEESYQKQLPLLIPFINDLAPYIPKRRKRKLHIGLFGYSRKLKGIKLPRAITFCAALYSYGLPPELLGLDALGEKDKDYIRQVYANFDNDLEDSLKYLNEENMGIFPIEIQKAMETIKKSIKYETDSNHRKVTSIILENFKNKEYAVMSENITRAGFIRGFLG